MNTDKVGGCLWGMAVGDALGLPAEGLTAARRASLFGEIESHRLFFGRGVVSDDTEHALLTYAAWQESNGELVRFEHSLRKKLMLWLVTLPPGVGLATLKACLRMWLGFRKPGVFSAGNGPAMRAPLLGVLRVDRDWVDASSRLTHTDPRALEGAWAIAQAAAGHWPQATVDSVENGEIPPIGYISGFVEHTVPAALAISYRYRDDFPAAIHAAIALGGDTDTVAAIVGGIVGARVGISGIPEAWRRGIIGTTPNNPSLFVMALTHAFALPIILAHGFRRLLPPY
ncbi:MAG: ADP-ribosylglycohydrolase family protein [Armatimonas sp.]